jgi:glycosyltransferase involved in cell wall biosynthesis
MAQAIAALIENPAKRQCLERTARKTAERDFDWDVIATRQRDLYHHLIKSAETSGSGPGPRSR